MEGKNIILVGFMGCGKTTIGKKLAKMFDYEFIDMDIEIEEKNGMKISDIFKEYGRGRIQENGNGPLRRAVSKKRVCHSHRRRCHKKRGKYETAENKRQCALYKGVA